MNGPLLLSVDTLKQIEKLGIPMQRVQVLMHEAGMDDEQDRSIQTLLFIGLMSALERISTLERESDNRRLEAMGDDL